MAALGQMTTKDLLYLFKDSFYSKVNIDSLISAMDQSQLLKKKEKKLLQRLDESAKKSFVFTKLYSADQLPVESLVELFTKTANEQNVHFSTSLTSKLSSLQKSATADTTSVATIIPVVIDDSGAHTAQVLTTPSLPPFKYHYHLDDNPSAIFSSSGGVLYSPVYGVTVYIPTGAILGEEQVEVSFRLVKEEAEIQELLSHPLFKGSILCSGVFEFKAKLVNAPDGEELGEFHSDVWIELPHCLSFGGCSLQHYSTAFVVSERRGKVEVEEQTLFSDGYPYVNLPVRHFSRFCVIHTPKKRFGTTKGQTTVPQLTMLIEKLRISNSLDSDQSASPHARCKKLKQTLMESATSSSAAEAQLRYIEILKTISEVSAEDKHHGHSFHDSNGHFDHQCDGGAIKVDLPMATPVNMASKAALQQESLHVAAVSVMACVCQPVGRDKIERWTAEIVFTPLLHKALKDLAMCQKWTESEIDTVAFRLELCLQLIRLHSEPSSNQGWKVELNTAEIMLEHLTTVTQLLEEDVNSSTLSAFLPRSTATVHNMGASLPLHHPVTVEGSWPTAHCYLTCQVGPRNVESTEAKFKTTRTEVVNAKAKIEHHQLQGPTAHSAITQGTGAPVQPLPPFIQWERDRYVLALLSIMIPEDHLAAFGESLGLSPLTIDHAMSGYTARSALNVGERAYEMFRRVSLSEQPLTFGRILVALNEIDRSDDLVPILTSYIRSGFVKPTFNGVSSETLAEADRSRDHLHSTLFITWLHANHPTLLPPACLPCIARDRAILPEEQQALFGGLSRRIVCVWRMVGRLLSLPDYEIEAVDIEGRRLQDGECEACYQMLLKWTKHSRHPSDITYYRLMAALQLTTRGVGAALDAIFYLNCFVLNLDRRFK